MVLMSVSFGLRRRLAHLTIFFFWSVRALSPVPLTKSLPQKIEMGLGVVAGLYGKKRQSQRAVSSGLGGGGGGGGKTRGGGDAMSKLRTTRYF